MMNFKWTSSTGSIFSSHALVRWIVALYTGAESSPARAWKVAPIGGDGNAYENVFSRRVLLMISGERENSISKKHISIIISIERDSCPSKEVYFVSDPPQVRNNYMAIVNIHARSFINEWERKYSKQADS